MSDIGLLILRIGLGVIFAAHGAQKMFGAMGGPGIEGFSQFLKTLGFSPAIVWAYIAASVELIGGVLVVAGIATRASSALIFVLIVIATVKVHLAKGFFLANGGFEYNLLILCVAVALIVCGPGKYSLVKKF